MGHRLVLADCQKWLAEQPPNSIHAVCTDPPYGLLEFSPDELSKLRGGEGGIWRIPPRIGGHKRDPLPRFTTLTEKDKAALLDHMVRFGRLLMPVLVPGAHVCIAGHPMLQYLVQSGMAEAGFEVRPAFMRLYASFRGGDRPKGAEEDYPEVCVTPKSACEPWMLFRKPLGEKTVAANLARWGTGALRRMTRDKPIPETIPSGRTPALESGIASHPCLKPQSFLRVIVRTLLPLGEGVVLDPYMGSGSTLAAATALGYESVGVEVDPQFFQLAQRAVPLLAALYPGLNGCQFASEEEAREAVLGARVAKTSAQTAGLFEQ